jgi:hypothetical protein
MKRLVAMMMCAVSLGAAAQSTITYPFNPDADGDSFIGVSDILEGVATYNAEFNPLAIQIDSVNLIDVIQAMQAAIEALETQNAAQGETIDAQGEIIDLLLSNTESNAAQIQALIDAGFITEEVDPIASSAGYITHELDPVANASGYATETWVEGQGYLTSETDPVATSAGYLTTETDPVASSAGYLTTESDPVAMQAMPTHLTDLSNWTDEDNDGWNDMQYATTTDVLNIARDYQCSNYFAPNNRTFSNQNFHDSNWSGAWLEGYTFVDSYMQNSSFRYASMAGVTFENTNLYDCDFRGADLTNSTWINSLPSTIGWEDNCKSVFEYANLTGADFSAVTWTPGWHAFNYANMTGATIPDFWDGGWYGEPSVMPDGWYIEQLSCVIEGPDECLSSLECYYIGNWPRRWRKAN